MDKTGLKKRNGSCIITGKHTFDTQMGRRMAAMAIEYTQKGDYLYPNIVLGNEEKPERPIGKYGRMRLRFLQENRGLDYEKMLLNCELGTHLEDTEEAANDRMDFLVGSLMKRFPPPDKAADMMGWVAHMNNLRAMAEETVLSEIVYA